jgi:predicted kinase
MLVLMCGPAGSGKSFASQKFVRQNFVRISSDELRAVIGSDEGDQSVSAQAFKLMEVFTRHFLKQGYNVVLDAMFLIRKSRQQYINIAKEYGVSTKIVFLNSSLITCLDRNKRRERKVPEDIITKQFERLEVPNNDEGAVIEIVND